MTLERIPESMYGTRRNYDMGPDQRASEFKMMFRLLVKSLKNEDYLARNLVRCADPLCSEHFPRKAEFLLGHFCPECNMFHKFGATIKDCDVEPEECIDDRVLVDEDRDEFNPLEEHDDDPDLGKRVIG